jgi:phosphatidylglycerophosphate synthase
MVLVQRLPRRVRPNDVTMWSLGVGLLGATSVGLSRIWWPALPIGVALVWASYVLDCADGLLARSRGQSTRGGATLDTAADVLVHTALGAGFMAAVPQVSLPLACVFVSVWNIPTVATYLSRSMGEERRRRPSIRNWLLASMTDFPVVTVVLALALHTGAVFGACLAGYSCLFVAVLVRLMRRAGAADQSPGLQRRQSAE